MTEHIYKPGDRIELFHANLIDTVRGKIATVTVGNEGGASYVRGHADDTKSPSADGWSFRTDLAAEPTEDEIAALFGVKAKREIHFLHVEARDIEFDGMAALCDWMNCLDEQPRVATESSRLPEEVTCQDCLNFMSRLAYIWIDSGVDHEDYHRGATTKVPKNPYWGDGA